MVKQKMNMRSRLLKELSEKVKIMASVEMALKSQNCPGEIAIESQDKITLVSIKQSPHTVEPINNEKSDHIKTDSIPKLNIC